MSDQNTALPVRTEGDLQEKIQSKIVDFIDPSLGMEVDSDKNAHVEIHGNDPTGTDKVVALSESGNVVLDGIYDVANNTVPSSVGLVASIRNAAPGLAQMLQRLTAVTNGLKRLLDVSIHDENGDAFSASNPLPVTISDSEGIEINDFLQSTAVAAAASADHDYTVTALKTLKLSQILASASGKMKVEVKIETGVATGIFATKAVQFNSTANPNCPFSIVENITVLAGVKVRVTLTNLDNQPQNLYSTISGHEI
jgi:hypothetical protein